MSDLQENEILKGIRDGNSLIIKEFYLKNLPAITSYVLKNSGSKTDAEDVFQDALVLIYQKLKDDSLQLTSSLSTFVYAVSRNIWMNKLRKRGKIFVNNELMANAEDLDASILKSIHKRDKQFLYQKHFLKLGNTCQSLLLHFFSGKRMAEIAKIMDYSEGYTRKKKFDCKKQLLETIEADALFCELTTKPDKSKNSR